MDSSPVFPSTGGTFQSFGTRAGHFRLKPELIKRSLSDMTDKEKGLARQRNLLDGSSASWGRALGLIRCLKWRP